jgi:hypothetical protein
MKIADAVVFDECTPDHCSGQPKWEAWAELLSHLQRKSDRVFWRE